MQTFFAADHGTLYCGNALSVLRQLPDRSVRCCVTSPPYWLLRDYGIAGQIGLEATPEEHVARLVEVFREVKRVLADDGTLWAIYGDTYSCSPSKKNWAPRGKQASNTASLSVGEKRGRNLPPKNLLGLPWRLAFALQDDGWILRTDIIWHKPNAMPESVTDRPTRSHEYVFLFSKRGKYFFNAEAVREPASPASDLSFNRDVNEPDRPKSLLPQHRPNRNPRPGVDRKGGNQGTGGIPVLGKVHNYSLTRNLRDVWSIATNADKYAHFATFPPALVTPCIQAGTEPGDIVLDPFFGSGTTGKVARDLGRRWIGIELNPEYCALALRRIDVNSLKLTDLHRTEMPVLRYAAEADDCGVLQAR
jgi:DNA modification methylase